MLLRINPDVDPQVRPGGGHGGHGLRKARERELRVLNRAPCASI